MMRIWGLEVIRLPVRTSSSSFCLSSCLHSFRTFCCPFYCPFGSPFCCSSCCPFCRIWLDSSSYSCFWMLFYCFWFLIPLVFSSWIFCCFCSCLCSWVSPCPYSSYLRIFSDFLPFCLIFSSYPYCHPFWLPSYPS